MTFDQTRRDLIALTVRYGARTPVGHHAFSLDALLSVTPAHERHDRRQRQILAVQTAGLANAIAKAGAV